MRQDARTDRPDPTQRFSDRVGNYIRYRPHYPQEILRPLAQDCGLTPQSVVADVGSGTGILTELFLNNGNQVHAIEPNAPMRQAAEQTLGQEPGFHSHAATAENTGLSDHSVDFVTAGQAFHWFDPDQARQEFKRILKPAGWVALVWNDRRTDSTPFLVAYEGLLRRWANDYAQVNHKELGPSVFERFFGPGGYRLRSFSNRQLFDFEGLQGRLLSSSYAPAAGTPTHQPMLRDLQALFLQHQQEGRVAFEYETKLYYGRPQVD